MVYIQRAHEENFINFSAKISPVMHDALMLTVLTGYLNTMWASVESCQDGL